VKAVVKNGVGVFSPQGFLDANNNSAFLSVEDMEATTNLKVDMILVSMKKVIFFNRNGLDVFIKLFAKIRKKNHTVVGFCDYDHKKYASIKKFYKNDINFSLFKSLEIAYLFSSNFKEKDKKILLYSSDKHQRSAMAIELHNNGHHPLIIQTQKEFEEKKVIRDLYDYVICDSYLGEMGNMIASRVTGNAIIYSVSSYLDADISDSFNIQYHKNSLNVGFRLFIFDAYKVISMNVHALNFFSRLASYAAEYNASIAFVGLSFDKTPEVFKENLEDSGILFYEQMDDILENKELLKELGASSAANIKQKRVINKATVIELPRFIDATVATIEMMTNSKAIKEAVEVHNIEITDKKDKIASSIGYYGDMDGMVILIFPTHIAKKACELLIGETTEDMELIIDTLAELANIVGGKIKTLLSDDNINVDITLPRTYQDIDSLLEVVANRKGVQVDLSFDDNKFLFFLTR